MSHFTGTLTEDRSRDSLEGFESILVTTVNHTKSIIGDRIHTQRPRITLVSISPESSSVSAALEPMAVDKGRAGLEQSRHHPNAGRSAYNGSSDHEEREESGSSEEGEMEKLTKKLMTLVVPGKESEAKGTLEELVRHI